MATDLYSETVTVPFMSKLMVFAKRHDQMEAKIRVFCVTDDKIDKTLETKERFLEVARSRDIEVIVFFRGCSSIYIFCLFRGYSFALSSF